MSMSIQTNVNALMAQENLRANNEFQGKTIQRLTSGYRINSSGDDAAGLAVANKFRSDTAELMQGVRNANDGISQLQIIDGGANNISKILDRMKTLATQASSTTFTGNRATLDTEFQALKGEIDRQAANVGLNSGGSNNAQMEVYIGGGGSNQANAKVSVDLSGSGNRIDSTGLGVSASSLQSGGVSVGSYDLRNKTNVLANTNNDGSQVFTFNLAGGGTVAATVTAATGGITGDNAVTQLNSALNASGISAFINSTTGILTFASSAAFSTTIAAGGGTGRVATNDVATAGATADNSGLYRSTTAGLNATWVDLGVAGDHTDLKFTKGGVSVTVILQGSGGDSSGTSIGAAINKLSSQLAGLGISVLKDAAGTNITFESSGNFTIEEVAGSTAAKGIFAAAGVQGATQTPTAGSSATANAMSAITALGNAVTNLGSVQGKLGAGQNKLQYAINLAQSQISGFSAAESRVRDTDVASEAANLTKAQVLVQASMAAMAQANSAPQAVLSLLRG
jgi:flagellin